jgi:two-component system, OmpR family, phosphate regulon sensor histidine kinase PhoR
MDHANQRPAPDEATMRARREQFASVCTMFDAAEMVLYVADIDTHELLYFSARAEEVWGRGQIGRKCYEVLQAGQNGPCGFCTNSRLVVDGRAAPRPVTWEFQNTVNRRWYLCIDKAIPWIDGRLVRMEVAIDVTERKLHEQFREQYVGLISHDLRTPISTIGMSAALLKVILDRSGVAEAGRPLEAISRSAKRLAGMIEDLLETTRLESGRLQLHLSSFDLAQLLATVACEMGAAASRAVRFEAVPAVTVRADAARIERVLENLIGNALRYSPPGTPVTVRLEANAAEATVTVADEGPGISPDESSKLFQRFSRAAGTSAGGIGLGLYNSRLIIEHHNGRIWVDSVPGSGSTFGFAVPLGSDRAAVAQAAAVPGPAIALQPCQEADARDLPRTSSWMTGSRNSSTAIPSDASGSS